MAKEILNDIGDLIYKLRQESLDYQQMASTSSTDAGLRKEQADVIKKVLTDVQKAEEDVKRKRSEGRRAYDTAQRRFTVSVDGLRQRDFGDDKRTKLNSIIVTIDSDIENYKKEIEAARREQSEAEQRREIAKLNQAYRKAVLERDVANLVSLPKVIQERSDALDKLHIKIGEALNLEDAVTAAILLTEFKVLLDAGDGLPGKGDKGRKYPLPNYEGLHIFIDPEYENLLVDRIIKDVPPRGDAETPDDKSKFGKGSLKAYVDALQETYEATRDLEKAKATLKELEEYLKARQGKRALDNIKKQYEAEPVVTAPPPSSPAQVAEAESEAKNE